MTGTIEDRLNRYAQSLDEMSAARVASLPMRADAPVAALPVDVATRRGGTRRVLAFGVVLVIVAAAITAVLARDRRSTTAPPTRTTVPTAVPRGGDLLRPLFTRTTPSGIVIAARAGRVSRADTLEGCPSLPGASTQPVECPKEPAVVFGYSVSGHEYRMVVFDSDAPRPGSAEKLVPMIVVGQVEQVRPDGRAVYWPGVAPYLVVMHATDVTSVRFHPHGAAVGVFDEMAPVSGWAAFIAPDNSIFDNKVAGLDAAGRVVATSLPWRCC